MPKTATKKDEPTAALIPTEKPVTIQERKSAGALLERAEQIKVTSDKTYQDGAEFLRDGATIVKAIKDRFSPWKKAMRIVVSEQKSIEDELLEIPQRAVTMVQGELSAFDEKRRKIREEQERKATEKAEEKAAKKREEDLEKLRESEDPMAQEKADELEEAPLEVEAHQTKRATPKTEGVSARQIWKFKVSDKMELIKAVVAGTADKDFIKVDEAVIGRIVRASQGKVKIPGISAYPETSMTAKARD